MRKGDVDHAGLTGRGVCRVGAVRFEQLCLLGRLPHQFGQGENFMVAAYAILKVPPKGHPQFPAGLFQAEKGIAAATAQLASRAGADLSFLRPFADVALREIVVQRNLRPLGTPLATYRLR